MSSRYAPAALLLTALLLSFAAPPAHAQYHRQTLPAGTLEDNDRLGTAVDVDGDRAVVGAFGFATFYAWDGEAWAEEQRVTSPSEFYQGRFGLSVAISGDCAVIGGYYTNLYGQAYVYCRTGPESAPWQFIKKLLFDELDSPGGYGAAVDVEGDILVVGRPGANEVEIHERVGGTWSWVHTLTPSNGYSGNGFGSSVALRGADVIVGAPGRGAGAAYVYRRASGNHWAQQAMLSPRAGAVSDARFGHAVALGDGFAVVGAALEHAGRVDSGELYVFKRAGSSWSEADRRTAGDTKAFDWFGHSVAVEGAKVLVGAPRVDPGANDQADHGAFYVFDWNGTALVEREKLTASQTTDAFFGHALAMSAGRAIVGAPGDGTRGASAGAAFGYILIPAAPADLRASDNSSAQNVNLTWTRVLGAAGYRVYRDGEPDYVAETSNNSYSDAQPPGALRRYRVAAYNALGEGPPAEDIGRTYADGRIQGNVTSTVGSGVPGVAVAATPYANGAATLDGEDDHVELLHHADLEVGNLFMIEGWIKADRVDGRQVIFSTRRHNEPGSWQLEIGNGSGGASGRVSVTTLDTWVWESASGVIPAGEWVHVAYARVPFNGSLIQRLFVNGAPVLDIVNSSPATLQDNASPKLIGAGTFAGQFFDGRIDELRLWNLEGVDHRDFDSATDYAFIRRLRQRHAGHEEHLAGYWRLDAAPGGLVADYAGGAHGALRGGAAIATDDAAPVALATVTDLDGTYRIDRIEYGTGTTYTATPSLEGHTFDPASRPGLALSQGEPTRSGVNFTDVTVFTVSGRLRFPGGCPVPGAAILVNGAETATTDAEGYYSLSVLTPADVTLTASYHGHAFEPAERTYAVITSNIEDADFTDVTTVRLRGVVAGGDCRLPVGQATVTVSGPGACFTALAQTDASGAYAFEGLPALPEVDVLAVVPSNPDIAFSTVPVALRDSSRTQDFLYRAPPTVALREFPAPVGSCGIRVVEQMETYGFYVDVTEEYGGQTCPVETGQVVFRGDVADAPEPDTVDVQGGEAFYAFVAGTPNIASGGAHPHQKLLGIEVVTGGGPSQAYGYSVNADAWLLVEGNRPREQTFATVSPEIPLLLLRDPPGDASYSYLSESTTACNAFGMSSLESASTDLWGRVKLGTEASISTGAVVSVGFNTAVWGITEGGLETTSSQHSQVESALCLTASQTFTTDQTGPGAGKDLFVGGAMNFLYAITDVLAFDPATCTVDVSADVIFAPGDFATTYVYTETFIRDNLIPRLQNLRDNPSTPADSVVFLGDQIDVWSETLALNERLRAQAVFLENVSFSGDATLEASATSALSRTEQVTFVMEVDEAVAVEAGLEIAGTGINGGVRAHWRTEVGESETTTEAAENTVGYVLADDDTGDFFSVDIRADPVYGTPVFALVSGESSCPWEPGTRPRDGVQLSSNTLVQSGVDPGGPAAFTLTLSNVGQSETDPSRQYYIAPLQESNPGGATLRLNGDAFNDGQRYTVPALGSVQAVFTVHRGPNAYAHENLQLIAYADCEYAAWQDGAPLQIVDTLTVSVHFGDEASGLAWSPAVREAAFEPGAGGVLSANLLNTAAAPVSFTLGGLPAWLTASTAGELMPPGATLPVTFTVSDTLSEGTYAALVNAQTGASTVPLSLVVTVGEGASEPGEPVTQAIPVGAGWNWFSIHVLPDDAAPTAVLATLAPTAADGDVLRGAGGTSQFFEGAWFGDLSAVTPGAGYLLNRANAGTLAVTGEPVDPSTPLTLGSGWSYLGYLPQAGLATDAALASIAAGATDGDVLRGRDGTSQFFGGAWFGQIGTMEPGAGYRLYRAGAESVTLVYPSATAKAGPAAQAVQRAAKEAAAGTRAQALDPALAAGWAVVPARFAHGMSLTAELVGGAPDAVLGAFAGDEVRGVGRAVYVPALEAHRYVMTLYSHEASGETLAFRVLDPETGAEAALDFSAAFRADSIAGTIGEPVRLLSPAASTAEDALPTEFAILGNYPNPFAATTQIPYTLPQPADVDARVVDVLGRTVATLARGEQEAGRHALVWDSAGAASGVYFCVVRAGDRRLVHKMLLVR